MIVYAYLDPGLFYKVTLCPTVVDRINSAKRLISSLQYNRISFDINVQNLTLGRWEGGEISIERERYEVKLNIIVDNERLLEEDVLDFEDIHITRRFKIMMEDAKNLLDEDDYELIRALK